MVIYVQILDQVNREKKNSMTGQMSLFDIVGEEQKSEFDIPLPNVGEYEKSTKLAFEKEVLGIYLSGHPMEEYEEQWRKGISKTTQDFQFDEELYSQEIMSAIINIWKRKMLSLLRDGCQKRMKPPAN